MVWHTFMLNPRNYLEDCVRNGKFGLWTSGFPWEAINNCINNETFDYSPSYEARQKFVARTRYAWDSLDDSRTINVECPKCKTLIPCPWTTCNSESKWSTYDVGKTGTGFAEKYFGAQCKNCHFVNGHEILRATKFRKDVDRLRSHNYPMPGTFLDKNGKISIHS